MGISLTDEQNDRVRAAARELVKLHDGNVSAAARAILKSQSWFSNLLQGERGCSLNTAALIAHALGRPVKDLLGVDPGLVAPVVKYSDIAGYDDSLEVAKRVSQFPARVWKMVGLATTMPTPTVVTPELLIKVAELMEILAATGAKSLTSGSDTVPPSDDGGGRKSGKLRKSR